jgi:hypothetical protein
MRDTAPTVGVVSIYGGAKLLRHLLRRWLDCRMFTDFQADAALIVHGKDEFIRRVGEAVAQPLPSAFSHGNVGYYDPYQIDNPSQLTPAFSKHFRYAYQDEYRMVWKPSEAGMQLEPFFVNIGPMSDIATMVELA